MPRQATGYVDSHPWKDGKTTTWRLCVRAYGRRWTITLGTNHEGWSEERSTVELDKVMEQIRRGTWVAPEKQTPKSAGAENTDVEDAQDREETIHVTLSRFWQSKKADLEANTKNDYRWRINLILGFRPQTPTAEIDAKWIDELRDWLAERPAGNRKDDSKLSPRSVNMVLSLLAQALDIAVDHKLLDQNPARGRRRRAREKKSKGFWLEPDMVVDLLDVAGEWERELLKRKRPDQCYGRRALLALLCTSGGPRINEAIGADRADFDLTADGWRIPDSKTQAGERYVEVTLFAAEELRSHVAQKHSVGRPAEATNPMWCTREGGRLNQNNLRRMLREVARRTNEKRAGEGKMLLPHVTPHTLRRTFASLCFFAGRELPWVMDQIGHDDPRMTLGVYAQTAQRKRIDRELVWRLMRFGDEPASFPSSTAFDTTNDTTKTKSPSRQSVTARGE